MPKIRFRTKLFKIHQWTILRLPDDASIELPSRSQVMVKGMINGTPFRHILEPDGKWSHWFKVDKKLRDAANVEAGDDVKVEIESIKEWPEPTIPKDLVIALANDPSAYDYWKATTTMARWEWIRWISATKQAETRQKRIRVSLSKLNAGEKRPCCFNRAMCTDPYVSNKGMLIEPDM